MPSVVIDGTSVNLKPSALIGSGGEADIYQLDASRVVKLFKQPGHSDFKGLPVDQLGAKQRIAEHQHKLAQFPQHVPPEVVAPSRLVYTKSGAIIGYVMPYVRGMEVLLRLGQRDVRSTLGIDGNQVVAVFRKLHHVVDHIHGSGVVIGDFNDLNVMTDGTQLALVDADSMQFGGFDCRTYTSRFVDPLRCAPDALRLVRPHDQDSDWYAYFVMLLQSLLYVGPYGGVHRPRQGPRLQHDDRVLARLTVDHSDVIYPKPALPLDVLPDEVRDYMQRVFEADERGSFPVRLLDMLRWTHCTQCGAEHARERCPGCQSPGAPRPVMVIRGTVTARIVFTTTGHILQAAYHNGALHYLYRERGVLYREDQQSVIPSADFSEVRLRLQGPSTIIARGNSMIVMKGGIMTAQYSVGTYRDRVPMFDASDRAWVWVNGDHLYAPGPYGPIILGPIIPSQTLVWTGDVFGVGLYRAGDITRGIVFRPDRPGINDQVLLGSIPGQIADAACVFSRDLAWLMLVYQHGSTLRHRCYVLAQTGEVVATADEAAGSDNWLGHSIRGGMAAGQSLFVATDDGIIRVGVVAGDIKVERIFPDTKSFVDTLTYLVPSTHGIYAVSATSITHLEIH